MKRLVLLACIFASPALAQSQPDPAFMQKATAAVQAQRNQALDTAAVAEAKLGIALEELAKAQARIKELEPKPSESK